MIELLVAIGIILVLLAMAIPVLRHARASGHAAQTLVRVRDISIALSGYALESRDLCPVFLPPVAGRYPEDPLHTGSMYGRRYGGYWFDHAWLFHIAFSPPLPMSSLLAPGSSWHIPEVTQEVQSVRFTDFFLSETLYTDPEYWTRFGQRGQEQWHAQRLTDIRFPSDKGVLMQIHNYTDPGLRPDQTIPGWPDVRGGVGWADLGVTMTYQRDLQRGIPNYSAHYPGSPRTYLDDGWPVHQTEHGIHGRDR